MSKGKFYCENVFRNILGVFLIIHASTLYSQISLDTSLSFPNYHIKKINTEDGLPLNEIMDLHFPQGLVWFDMMVENFHP